MTTIYKLLIRSLDRGDYYSGTLNLLLDEIDHLPEEEKHKNRQHIMNLTTLQKIAETDPDEAKQVMVSIMDQLLQPDDITKEKIPDLTRIDVGRHIPKIPPEPEAGEEQIWKLKLRTISNDDLFEIKDEQLEMLHELTINTTASFNEPKIMDSELNNIVSGYLEMILGMFPSMTPKLIVLLFDILTRYGWDKNNFNMPPNREKIARDLSIVTDRIQNYLFPTVADIEKEEKKIQEKQDKMVRF